MSTDSYATSSASESQEPEIGGEMMVVEGSFKYKSWLWEHFTCVTSGSKREKAPPSKVPHLRKSREPRRRQYNKNEESLNALSS